MKIARLALGLLALAPAALAASAPAQVPSPDLQVNDFGVRVLKQLASRGSRNVFISPLSLHLALSMAGAGANGKTEREFAQVLGGDSFYRTDWYAKLQSRFTDPATAPYGILTLSNHIYPESGGSFHLEPKFQAAVKQNFSAMVRGLDFQAAPEPARAAINADVAHDTNGLITDLLPAGSIQSSTRLVLTNAIYFKGAWQNEFPVGQTKPGPFYGGDASPDQMPMMHVLNSFYYAKKRDYVAFQLPYRMGQYAMLVLLPARRDGLKSLLAHMDAKELRSLIQDDARFTRLKLSMPRFKASWGTTDLGTTLQEMGLRAAFVRGQADFSPINGQASGSDEALYISGVFHKAWISVDEKGSEAAAATAVTMFAGAAMQEPAEPVTVNADHPFYFAIIERASGLVLFAGTYHGP